MSRRLRISLGVLAIVVAGSSMLAERGQLPWLPALLAAQTRDAQEWTPPKTPWGDPDLQGIYNYGTSTPLQRPEEVGDKEVLSDEEAEVLQAEIARRLDRDRRDGGAEADVGRSYNDIWMDPARMRLTEDKRTSLIIDPPNGRLPPRVQRELTPEQLQAQAAQDMSTRRFNTNFQESYLDMDVGNRCIIRRRNEGGGHPYLPAIYNNMAQILQSPGYVTIYAEMIHFARIIPVDGRPPLPDNVETWLGDPRGHWEGDTLVVETRNFVGVKRRHRRPHRGRLPQRESGDVHDRRTVHPHGAGDHRVSGDDVRSGNLDAAVHHPRAVEQDDRSDLRVPVSGNELRHVPLAPWSPRTRGTGRAL